MSAGDKIMTLISLFLAILLVISFGSSTPITITFYDTVDHNVTYNATTAEEIPDESQENSSKRLTGAFGKILIESGATEDIADVNILIKNTEALTTLPDLLISESTVFGKALAPFGWDQSSGGDIYLHIPDLPAGGYVTFNYTINTSEIYDPINLTGLAQTELGGGRIFTDEIFNHSLFLMNKMENTVIKANVTQYLQNNFYINQDTSPHYLLSQGFNTTYSDTEIHWNNISLYGMNNSASWSFSVKGPTSKGALVEGITVENGTLITYGVTYVNFTANDTIWPVVVDKVTAKPDGMLSVTKEHPDKDIWVGTPQFNNTSKKLFYQLNKVSIWSIASSNIPTDIDPGKTPIANSYFEWNESSNVDFPVILSPGENWKNETGHTFTSTSVPIIYGNVSATMVDNSSTVTRLFSTKNRTQKYVYYEQILLIYTYFLEATKSIEPLDNEGEFNVTITLRNIGRGRTPNGTILADFLPGKFNMTYGDIVEGNMTINWFYQNKTHIWPNENKTTIDDILWAKYGGIYNFSGKSPASGAFLGDWVYFWELKSLVPNETIIFNYRINGSGEFDVSQLFMIGVDPINTNNLASSKAIRTLDGMKLPSETMESVTIPLSMGLLSLSLFFSSRKRKT